MLADTSMEMVLRIPFLSLSNADVKFAELGKLTRRLYTAADAPSTTSRFELIDKREFAKAALDENSKSFMIYVAAIKLLTAMPIHPSRAAQVLDDSTLAVFQ